MADIIDIIRALNAPPALGEFSAARAQPYLNTGIGTGGGMQLVMKDQQGVGQAADRWARARMETADPFANLIWGDTVGGAQNSLLNERARQVQLAMAREQMDAQRERENRITRQAQEEQITRRQIGQQQFLSRIAETLADARGDNADALENAARLRQLTTYGGRLDRAENETEQQATALRRLLSENARNAVAGNPDIDFRIGSDGLPEIYSPTRNANANQLRAMEANIFRGLPYGVEGPSPVDPREQYSGLDMLLRQLDDRRQLYDRDVGSALRQPTTPVDVSLLEQLLGGGGSAPAPTIGQSAAQLLQQAMARGATYRLPPTPTGARDLGPIRPTSPTSRPYRPNNRLYDVPLGTDGTQASVPRWTFDPESLRFV